MNQLIVSIFNTWKHSSFDLWVMHEYGIKESWSKTHKVVPISGVEKLWGFWKNFRLLLMTMKGRLVLYDPTSQKIKDVQIDNGPNGWIQLKGFYLYVKSLFYLKGRRGSR